jgi:hypothetical protein
MEWISALSFMSGNESLRYHSWRGMNLFAIIHGVEWISALSFMAWNESLRYHSWRKVKVCAIIHGAERRSPPSFMMWSKSWRHHSWRGVNLCTIINETRESLHHVTWQGVNLHTVFQDAIVLEIFNNDTFQNTKRFFSQCSMVHKETLRHDAEWISTSDFMARKLKTNCLSSIPGAQNNKSHPTVPWRAHRNYSHSQWSLRWHDW